MIAEYDIRKTTIDSKSLPGSGKTTREIAEVMEEFDYILNQLQRQLVHARLTKQNPRLIAMEIVIQGAVDAMKKNMGEAKRPKAKKREPAHMKVPTI
tara:strand:+ start:576 stop:866 length:291 start_codon:yes stop_codon:yes gene_type:complete